MVPGHEIIGRVTEVGPKVSNYKPGDVVGVGCLVDSCRSCSACDEGLEQYCLNGMVPTYNGEDRHDGSITYGGYSERIVVSDRFVVKVPDALDPAAAPLLLPVSPPIHRCLTGRQERRQMSSMSGLGHMGVKFAKAPPK